MLRSSSPWVLGCLVLCLAGSEPTLAANDRTDSQRMRAVLGGVATRQQLDALCGVELACEGVAVRLPQAAQSVDRLIESLPAFGEVDTHCLVVLL